MMSQSGYVTARETEIIRILRVLTEASEGFVVIGGYAVNAHGQHRFSVDCELATNRDNVPVIDATLLREGYELRRSEVRPPIGVTIREYARSVAGATGSTPSRVAQRNLLVAMKLHAGETLDFEDVVMLSERVDWKTVAKCAACGSKEQLLEDIEAAIQEISSPKFASELKSIFAMRSDPTLLTKRANLGLQSLRTLVAQEKFKDSL